MKWFFLLIGASSTITFQLINDDRSIDTFYWPASGQGRIENMADILRKIEGPARWCYPSQHPLNISDSHDNRLARCLSKIEPKSPFIELGRNDYIKRFYGASFGSDICEVTLSTVWKNDRIAGSDCYYGLFHEDDYRAVGMTDDPFG